MIGKNAYREDKYTFFVNDVSREAFPDYYVHIAQPMSFRQIREKIENETYTTEEQFWVRK